MKFIKFFIIICISYICNSRPDVDKIKDKSLDQNVNGSLLNNSQDVETQDNKNSTPKILDSESDSFSVSDDRIDNQSNSYNRNKIRRIISIFRNHGLKDGQISNVYHKFKLSRELQKIMKPQQDNFYQSSFSAGYNKRLDAAGNEEINSKESTVKPNIFPQINWKKINELTSRAKEIEETAKEQENLRDSLADIQYAIPKIKVITITEPNTYSSNRGLMILIILPIAVIISLIYYCCNKVKKISAPNDVEGNETNETEQPLPNSNRVTIFVIRK